jgi:hypothetical protein
MVIPVRVVIGVDAITLLIRIIVIVDNFQWALLSANKRWRRRSIVSRITEWAITLLESGLPPLGFRSTPVVKRGVLEHHIAVDWSEALGIVLTNPTWSRARIPIRTHARILEWLGRKISPT